MSHEYKLITYNHYTVQLHILCMDLELKCNLAKQLIKICDQSVSVSHKDVTIAFGTLAMLLIWSEVDFMCI